MLYIFIVNYQGKTSVPVGDALGEEAAEDGADAVGQPERRQREPVGRGAPLLEVLVDG